MSSPTDILLVGLVLADLWLLASSRISSFARAVALQGLMLGLFPFLAHLGDITGRELLLGVVSTGLKGALFPWLILRTMRRAAVNREVRPYVGFTASLVIGCLAFAAAWGINSNLSLHVASGYSQLASSVALLSIFVGLFLVVSRQTALSQTVGYLVFENGIYLFGLVLVEEIPLLLELGVLLDAFVALFAMGIATYQIRNEFDHIDTDRLDSLKG